MPQGAGTVIEVTIPVGAGRNVTVQCHLTDFHLFTEVPVTAATPAGTMGRLSKTECTYLPTYLNYLTQFNVVRSTVRALSWVAETLHRLHDFWSRSATQACAETLSGSLNLSSGFI